MKLKVASNYPATSLFSKVQQHYFDEVTKRTNGRVTFEYYYGGVLLKASDVYPGLSRGAVDIGYTVPAAFNPREYPLAGVTLPFVTEMCKPQATRFAIGTTTHLRFKKNFSATMFMFS